MSQKETTANGGWLVSEGERQNDSVTALEACDGQVALPGRIADYLELNKGQRTEFCALVAQAPKEAVKRALQIVESALGDTGIGNVPRYLKPILDREREMCKRQAGRDARSWSALEAESRRVEARADYIEEHRAEFAESMKHGVGRIRTMLDEIEARKEHAQNPE